MQAENIVKCCKSKLVNRIKRQELDNLILKRVLKNWASLTKHKTTAPSAGSPVSALIGLW